MNLPPAVLDRTEPLRRTAALCEPSDSVAAINALLSLPDEQLDYARAKLAIDTIVDPTMDPSAVLAALDRLVDEARTLVGADAAESDKLGALRTVIYEAGPWNDHRPFAYDHADPLGQSLQARLLAHYLATRRGNCVSMPILFLILADRLGINMALSTAPLHIFLRHTDANGRVFNLEATSGALPTRDEWYRQNMLMTGRALSNGIYMRTLTRRESVALMASAVVEHLIAEGRPAEAIAASEIILRRNPRDVYVMVKQGTAYGRVIDAEFGDEYPVPFLIPARLRPRYAMLMASNRSAFAAAEALGWEPVA